MIDENINPAEFERIKRKILIYNEIGKTLTSSLTLKEVVEKIFYKVVEFFNPENWSLLLLDEDTQELYFEIVVGEVAEKIKDVRLKVGEGVAGWVAETGRALIVPSVDEEPRFSRKIDDISQFSTESIICIPLKVRNKILGVIELINKKNLSPFLQYDIEVLSTVAEYAAIALENAMNYEQVQRMTITDDISGLYNSRHLHNILQSEIDRCEKDNNSFSIIFFDLDFFKKINDSYGHLIGSSMLGKVGKLVLDCLIKDYCAARYGGDEFVIILPGTPKTDAVAFCRTIREKLTGKKFLTREGLNIKLTASFGIAAFPDDADTKDKLLQIADEQMYKVKEAAKNDIAFC